MKHKYINKKCKNNNNFKYIDDIKNFGKKTNLVYLCNYDKDIIEKYTIKKIS